MKAIVVTEFGDENVLCLRDAAVPEPGENEVRVRLQAVGFNPVEVYIRSGKYGKLPTLPYTPGTDGAGVVDKTGAKVKQVSEGDRVFVAASLARRNTGTYAEYVVCDADAVRQLPDNVPFAQGAGLGTPGLAAACALFTRASISPGEVVLVHGATGGVGTLAVQLARRMGATVFGTAGDAAGEAVVRELGAHRVFNHKEEEYIHKIAEAADGGVDVVIEMLANVNLARDLSVLAKRGRVVIVGSRGSLDFAPRDAMAIDAAILGMMVGNMAPDEFKANMSTLSAALEGGMRVVVGEEMPLAQAAQAHRAVMEEGNPGKVIMTI